MDRYLSGLGRREDRPDLPQEEEEEDRSFLTFSTFPESCDVMNQARFVFDEFDESVIPETPRCVQTDSRPMKGPYVNHGTAPNHGTALM